MDADTFLTLHNQGIGKLLGIELTGADRSRVVATMETRAEHLTRPDVIHGGVIMALADCAGAYGAVLNLPEGMTTATIESSSNFFRKGSGSTLRAVSTPLHVGSTVSIWRTTVYRGDDEHIAEVTQTQIVIPERSAEAEATETLKAELLVGSPDQDPDDGDSAFGRTDISRGFSQRVVDDRRRQIFEGASNVIAEKGFAKATIREIAARSGIPVPTMYQYVKRKEDLLYGIYEYFMADIVDALQQWRHSEAVGRDRLEGAIRTLIERFDKNHRYIKIMFQETRSLTPDARQKVYELDAHYITIIRELLESLVQEGDIDLGETELSANVIYFLCTIWPLRYWSIGKFGVETVADEIVAFVLRGLGATREAATTDTW